MLNGFALHQYLSDRTVLADGLATVGLLLVLLVLRFSLGKLIAHNPNFSLEQRRRWRVSLRNGLIVLFLIGVVAVWASELHALMVSLAAFAVALVVAGKELILCISGALLRSGGRLYEVGDRIEIGPHCGQVIDINLFSTTLTEDDPDTHQRTGRAIAIPNSLLWNHAVVRDSLAGDFILHQFEVPMTVGADWQAAEQTLLELARAASAEALPAMQASARELAERHALSTARPEASVTLQYRKVDELVLIVHVPTSSRTRRDVEQRILRAYLASPRGA